MIYTRMVLRAASCNARTVGPSIGSASSVMRGPDRIQMIACGKAAREIPPCWRLRGLPPHQSWATREPSLASIAQHAFGTARAQASIFAMVFRFQCRTESRQSRDAQPPSQNGSAAHKATAERHMNERGSPGIQCPVSTIRHAFHYAALRLKGAKHPSPINGKRERQTAHSALNVANAS